MDEDLVLHELRVRGTAADAGSVADRLVDAGFAIRRRSMLMLTPAGRAEADVRFCVLGTPSEEFVHAAYPRFGPLNRSLIQICNDWQVRAGGVPNDHRDPVYDWGVIDRLVAHDQQTGPVVASLGRQVSRFAQYRERLRGRAATWKRKSTIGCSPPASTRTTRSGCSSTRICCSGWVSNAPMN